MKQHRKSALRRVTASLLAALCLLGVCLLLPSCAVIRTVGQDETYVRFEPFGWRVKLGARETEGGSGTGEDPLPPAPFADAVEYTGGVHQGVGIRYNGSGDNKGTVIAIDPGHQEKGNNDREPLGPGSNELQGKVSYGTTGTFTGLREPYLTLSVALALRDKLIARGYSVVMIRETNDVDVSNRERAEIANAAGAAVFIRIHANGWDTDELKGAMTVCQTSHNPFPDCAAHYASSRALCEDVLSAFCQGTGMSRYSLWETDTKAGTNWSRVPTCILEMGFMSNEHDDTLMASPSFPQTAAAAILEGIERYLER